jgi:hypothetical protein
MIKFIKYNYSSQINKYNILSKLLLLNYKHNPSNAQDIDPVHLKSYRVLIYS